MKLETQSSYISNPQFVGGVVVTPVTGSAFDDATPDNPQFGFVAGGLYVGGEGDVTLKTYDGSVLTFTTIQGFIPGIITAVSGSSTAVSIIALR
jgi:hypothetical protein